MKYCFHFLIILLFAACSKKNNIADPDDYSRYLKPGIIRSKMEGWEKQISFWQNRLQKDTGNCVDMVELAACHLQLFRLTGNIDNLNRADSFLLRSNTKLNSKDPEILFAISQNKISQHKFRDAAMYVTIADKAGADQYTVHLLEFDTKMELGDKFLSEKKLASLKDKASFDYLLRRAKLEDQAGNLDKAIALMEQAFEKVKNERMELYCWALSNLGDMYGHAGRIREAYHAYLAVLYRDNSYLHALKGIAWIAYSNDKNSAEAKRINNFLLSETNAPEIWLTLAEIEEWEHNSRKKDEYISRFICKVEDPAYGSMYSKYLVDLYANEINDLNKALEIAQKEMEERTTPETYDWLAWVYFRRNELDKAYTIANNYVYRRNFEPEALWHTAMIFLAAGKKEKAKELLKECSNSSFELGPVKTRLARQQLN